MNYKEKLKELVKPAWIDLTKDKEEPKYMLNNAGDKTTVWIKKSPFLNNKGVREYTYMLFINTGKKKEFSTLELAKKEMEKVKEQILRLIK